MSVLQIATYPRYFCVIVVTENSVRLGKDSKAGFIHSGPLQVQGTTAGGFYSGRQIALESEHGQ